MRKPWERGKQHRKSSKTQNHRNPKLTKHNKLTKPKHQTAKRKNPEKQPHYTTNTLLFITMAGLELIRDSMIKDMGYD